MAASGDDTMKVRAQAKWVRTSARKARLVLDHIRGRSVPEARTILAFTQRAAATDIEKVLRSAVANAEANHGLDGDDLVVEAAYADEGPTLKRWKPRARRSCQPDSQAHVSRHVDPFGAAGSERRGKAQDSKGGSPTGADRREVCRRVEAQGFDSAAKEGGGGLMSSTPRIRRVRMHAATRRIAASSVAPVPSRYERSLVLALLAFRGLRRRSAQEVT